MEALGDLQISYPASLLIQLSWIAEERMGGTSGAIYSLMFKAAASEFAEYTNGEECWTRTWLRVWKRAMAGITRYSKATPGDRTMVKLLSLHFIARKFLSFEKKKKLEIGAHFSYLHKFILQLDTLVPACEALEKNLSSPFTEIIERVTKAAWAGCEATKNMTPM